MFMKPENCLWMALSGFVNEHGSCSAIDVKAPLITPFTKFFGIDGDAYDGMTLGNKQLLGLFSNKQPHSESGGAFRCHRS